MSNLPLFIPQSIENVGTEISDKLNPHLLSLFNIKDKNLIGDIHPNKLINSRRFDIMAKYIYIKYRELNIKSDWGLELYCEHLKVLNGFHEGDGSAKINKEAFIKAFNEVFDGIKETEFNKNYSLLPIGNNHAILDGAHRVATCLYLNKIVKGIYMDVDSPHCYDYQFFRDRGLPNKYLDFYKKIGGVSKCKKRFFLDI